MRRLAWSPARGSLTAACLSFFTLSFIGLTYLNVPSISSVYMMVHRCLSGCAPQYLATYCVPVSSIGARQHLRSAVRHQLAVPSHRLSTYGRRAFAMPARRRGTHCQHTFVVWRTAPLHLDDHLRLICFLSTSVYSALVVSAIMRYINRRFTYLLTYLHIAQKRRAVCRR